MFDKYYMCNFKDDVNISSIPSKDLQRIWQCDWTRADIEEILCNWLKYVICNPDDILSSDQVEKMFCDSIQLILVFAQHNFTGPFTQAHEYKALIVQYRLNEDYNPFEKLSENGEEVNTNMNLGEILVIAKLMLTRLMRQFPDNFYVNWWYLRVVCMQQQMLEDLTQNLYDNVKTLTNWLKLNLNTCDDIEERAVCYLEMANAFLLFHRFQICDELLGMLCLSINATLEVRGLMGLRTKFQQTPLPQLCLYVEQGQFVNEQTPIPTLSKAKVTHGSTELPKLLLLEDDTRLERIKFIEPQDDEAITIPSILQAIILSKIKCMKRAQPDDRLRDEQTEPYLQTLIYQQQGPLQVRMSALLANCVQESKQRRTVERSWKQCEEILKIMHDIDLTSPSLFQRLSYVFAAHPETYWSVQFQHCELLLSLGMTKTALDIYLRLEAWHQVIECYNRLELRHKAAEIIRNQIEVKPSVLLYCLLGNTTEDPSCFETAWKLSNGRSGKAQAFWGNYYFRRKDFAQALTHLRISVDLNPLQELIWLRLGYAAMALRDWELAAHSYVTYTHLDPNGFEAWNNLAKALIKLGDKPRAHKILQDALKCNYNNWKVWENFMVVSVDLGHFDDTLNAYKRLSELKQRYIDLEVLRILIKAIAAGKPDAKGHSREYLLKKATELMGHQCVKHGNDYVIWELASLIADTPLKKAQKLLRCYRSFVCVDKAWATKPDTAHKALKICRELCQHSLTAITEFNEAEGETMTMILSQVKSARITAHGCTRALEMSVGNSAALWKDVNELLEKLKDYSDTSL